MMPDHIKIGWRRYTTGQPPDAVQQDGAHQPDPPVLLIRSAKSGPQTAHTAYHEVWHAFCEVYGKPPLKDEEAAADWFAGAMVSLVLDNPNFVAWINQLVRSDNGHA